MYSSSTTTRCLWFFFSSRRRHTRWNCDWSSDVCSSDLDPSLVSRQMVEDVLRYKRLDGVQGALEALTAEWFPNGVQRENNAKVLAALDVPSMLIWGDKDRIIQSPMPKHFGI